MPPGASSWLACTGGTRAPHGPSLRTAGGSAPPEGVVPLENRPPSSLCHPEVAQHFRVPEFLGLEAQGLAGGKLDIDDQMGLALVLVIVAHTPDFGPLEDAIDHHPDGRGDGGREGLDEWLERLAIRDELLEKPRRHGPRQAPPILSFDGFHL